MKPKVVKDLAKIREQNGRQAGWEAAFPLQLVRLSMNTPWQPVTCHKKAGEVLHSPGLDVCFFMPLAIACRLLLYDAHDRTVIMPLTIACCSLLHAAFYRRSHAASYRMPLAMHAARYPISLAIVCRV